MEHRYRHPSLSAGAVAAPKPSTLLVALDNLDSLPRVNGELRGVVGILNDHDS